MSNCPFPPPCPYKRPTTAVKGVEGRRMGRAVPLARRLQGLGERRKLPRRGLGQSPSRKRFGGISCTILCDFTHLLVHLTVAWKWEIPTSLYWLVGLVFRISLFCRCRTPQLEFLGCTDTNDTHSCCAADSV